MKILKAVVFTIGIALATLLLWLGAFYIVATVAVSDILTCLITLCAVSWISDICLSIKKSDKVSELTEK